MSTSQKFWNLSFVSLCFPIWRQWPGCWWRILLATPVQVIPFDNDWPSIRFEIVSEIFYFQMRTSGVCGDYPPSRVLAVITFFFLVCVSKFGEKVLIWVSSWCYPLKLILYGTNYFAIDELRYSNRNQILNQQKPPQQSPPFLQSQQGVLFMRNYKICTKLGTDID